jgi:hypothetical protein
MSRIDSLRARLLVLEDNVHAGRIPTTSADGQRAWIDGGGSGLSFLRFLTLAMRDGGTADCLQGDDDLRAQCELWARAEVDGSDFGEIARMCRAQARCALKNQYAPAN